ncbi:unnamed protein product [Lymnaea stagnalis]|uniref:Uncharacterized protein n=1 Tax=Lymnaea stagnalis TaxID=6523 RepID=A0AAV2HJC2_LYMST
MTKSKMDTRKNNQVTMRVGISLAIGTILCALPTLGLTSPVIYDGQNTCDQNKPKICPYYKNCCRLSQYCSDRSRACEPCFPSTMDIQEWFTMCQTLGVHNVSWLSHETCVLACLDIFTYEELYSTENGTTHATASAGRSSDTSDELQDCKDNNRNLIFIFAAFAIVLVMGCACRCALKNGSLQKYVCVASVNVREMARNCFHHLDCTRPRRNGHEDLCVRHENNNRENLAQEKLEQTINMDTEGATGGVHYEDEEHQSNQKLLSKVTGATESLEDDERDDREAAGDFSPHLKARAHKKLPVPKNRYYPYCIELKGELSRYD